VAYTETPPARRKILHRRIAQALELLHGPDLDPVAGQIAAHLEAAGQTRRAGELYERAADVASRVSAFAEVMRDLDRALALLALEAPSRGRDEHELALLFRRSPALNAVEGYTSPRQEAAFVRARELAEGLDRPRDVSTAIIGAVAVAIVGGRIDEANESSDVVVARPSHPDDRSATLVGHGGARASRGDLEGAIGAFRQAIASYRPGRSRPTMPAAADPASFACAWGAHALWLNGRTDEALRWSADAIRRAETLNHPYTMTIARSYAAILAQLCGDIPALSTHGVAVGDLCARYGFAYYPEWPTIFGAWADRDAADNAAARIEGALHTMNELKAFLRRPYYLGLLADVHRAAGRRDAALAALSEALAVANSNGEHWWTPEIHRLAGELAPTPEDANTHLELALATARTQASHALALRAGISIVRRHPDRRDLLVTLLAATASPSERERTEAAELLAPHHAPHHAPT
jgi:tetratricopeptide (TPR) repeat protein